MVLRSMEKIKAKLSGVLEIVMFYNDGTVFQTTLPPNFNIPELGNDFSKTLANLVHALGMYDVGITQYRKLFYETDKYLLVIIKLGEDSNLGLLLDNTLQGEFQMAPIQQYIQRLQELLDMDREEIAHIQQQEENESNLQR